MQSFSASSRAPIDADSLPPDSDVRHFLLDDGGDHAVTSSFREMLFRVGTQLQLSDDTVAGSGAGGLSTVWHGSWAAQLVGHKPDEQPSLHR